MGHRPPSRRHEAPQIGAMAARVIRSLARRSAEGDVEGLEELVKLQAVLDQAIAEAAQGLHDHGHSWTYIGDALGITRQAARQRFARPAVDYLAPGLEAS